MAVGNWPGANHLGKLVQIVLTNVEQIVWVTPRVDRKADSPVEIRNTSQKAIGLVCKVRDILVDTAPGRCERARRKIERPRDALSTLRHRLPEPQVAWILIQVAQRRVEFPERIGDTALTLRVQGGHG